MSFARSSTIWIAFVLMLSVHEVAMADANVVATVGASRLVIPPPIGLVSVAVAPEVEAVFHRLTTPNNRLLAAFVSPRELDEVSRGIGQGFSRHFRVDVDKEAEVISVDRASWTLFVAGLKRQYPARIEPARTGGLQSLGLLDEAANAVAFGQVLQPSLSKEVDSRQGQLRIVAFVNFNGLIGQLTAYSQSASEGEVRMLTDVVKAWTSTVLRANEDREGAKTASGQARADASAAYRAAASEVFASVNASNALRLGTWDEAVRRDQEGREEGRKRLNSGFGDVFRAGLRDPRSQVVLALKGKFQDHPESNPEPGWYIKNRDAIERNKSDDEIEYLRQNVTGPETWERAKGQLEYRRGLDETYRLAGPGVSPFLARLAARLLDPIAFGAMLLVVALLFLGFRRGKDVQAPKEPTALGNVEPGRHSR